MCTVTFIPKSDGFIFSSNRDESPLRAANDLFIEQIGDQRILFPKDLKGGSWFFASDNSRICCLLNGAFIKHNHQPPYRMSRGVMLKDVYSFIDIIDFLRNYDLKNIEPFTLISIDRNGLIEVRWDGSVKHAKNLNQQTSHIWSSSTLYTQEMEKERALWFEEFKIGSIETSLDSIKTLHRTGGQSNEHFGYVMNRENRVRTISITHVVKENDKLTMEFENLIQPEIQVRQINLKKPVSPSVF